MPPTTDKVKELREWSTFGVSVLTLICIPIIILVLNNQEYKIEREVAKEYTSKESFVAEKSSRDATDREQWQKIGELNGKIDTVILNQARQGESLSGIKEQLQKIKP